MASSTHYPPIPEPTISDIEQAVQDGLEALRHAPLNDKITTALKFLTPDGYRPVAQLEEDGRKKRSNAAGSNWNPETGEILIYFERISSSSSQSLAQMPDGSRPVSFEAIVRDIHKQRGLSSAPDSPESRSIPENNAESQSFDSEAVTPWQISECCQALAEAEKAGKAFIALRWFRDQGLTVHDYSWATSPACRQAVLAKAIDVGAILTASIPNPKAPQHPTTTIKLNRESEHALGVTPRYQPIQLRGDGPTASEILLRDRGRF